MTLERACEILTAAGYCEAAWSIAFNGIGPHAWGITKGRRPNIALAAEDAIRLAAELEQG